MNTQTTQASNDDGRAGVSDEVRRTIEAAYRRYESRLFHAALRITRDEAEAWDAVQDGMVSALRHGERFNGASAVESWLYSIVVNAALYRRRRDGARRRGADKYVERVWPEADRSLEAGTAQSDPESFVHARIDLERVAEHLESLPADRRELLLRAVDGETNAQLAAELGEPQTAVKSRLWRLRNALRADFDAAA